MKLSYKQGSIEQVLEVEQQIPEFAGGKNLTTMLDRLKNKHQLILIALDGEKPIAYKMGYALSDSSFYSWLGAVIPAYRRRGIANHLRLLQEQWALDNGYNSINVKSMNRFPAMLQMLISSGYKVCGFEDKGNQDLSKIKFVKQLNKTTK